MPKKYLYMQNGSDKFKPLPPIYGKVPLRYRDRHHIINGDVYDCTGNDLLTSIDPLSKLTSHHLNPQSSPILKPVRTSKKIGAYK